MTETTQDPTVTRMPPGETVPEAVQGWAMTQTAPTGGPARDFDLLFVHGMASGGWIWSQPWLDAFASAGYRSWTITLPGRDGGGTLATNPHLIDDALSVAFSTGDGRAALDMLVQGLPGMPLIDGPSLDDFTDAIATSLDQIGRPAAVVAHSLGGAAAQNLLKRGRRPAATVLLASVPPYGLWRASMEMAILNPDLFGALADFTTGGINRFNIGTLRANLFPGGISDAEFEELVPQMTDESLRAMAQAQGFPPFAPFPGPRSDVMVLGGSDDRLVPMQDVWATAMYYGGFPTIIPKAGHVLMMGDQVPAVTREILGFLETRTA